MNNNSSEFGGLRHAGASDSSLFNAASQYRVEGWKSTGSPTVLFQFAHCSVNRTTASYQQIKDNLSGALGRLVAEQLRRLPYSSHMVINGNDHADCKKLFHTMSQHFRKILRRNGARISWMKFKAFTEQGKSHIHVILFHDVPLYKLFRRQENNKSYDVPHFSNPADRLRRVHGRSFICFRSFNYKIDIKEHNNPQLLAGEYMLNPRNFRPDLVSESHARWFSASRDIVHRRSVMPLFNKAFRTIDSLEKVFKRRGMEELAGPAVEAVVHGNTDKLERMIIARIGYVSATRDRTVSRIPDAPVLVPTPIQPRGAEAVRRCRLKQPP